MAYKNIHSLGKFPNILLLTENNRIIDRYSEMFAKIILEVVTYKQKGIILKSWSKYWKGFHINSWMDICCIQNIFVLFECLVGFHLLSFCMLKFKMFFIALSSSFFVQILERTYLLFKNKPCVKLSLEENMKKEILYFTFFTG